MEGKKYLIVLALAWLIILVWAGVAIREPARFQVAEAQEREQLIEAGAKLYASNCATCHGPQGEGVVGPPLNRDNFRGDPADNRETYDLIYNTIDRGRPGTTEPKWVRLRDGSWASFTAMPTWGRENGGPLNEQQIEQLTTFIMAGDWNKVSRYIPKATGIWETDAEGRPTDTMLANEEIAQKLPQVEGLSQGENDRARLLFASKTCVVCHKINGVGGNIGPDLSKVGSWGLDYDFVYRWIENPSEMENRAPTHWSNFGGPLLDILAPPVSSAEEAGSSSGDVNPPSGSDMAPGTPMPEYEIPQGLELGPTVMPTVPMTEEERDLLVRYLLRLK